jgi:hypothetical protein
MTPQAIFLFIPNIIYYFLLSIFEVQTLGYSIDISAVFVIALLFWLNIYQALLAILKKLFNFSPRGQ